MSLPPVSVVLNEVIDALGRAPQVLLHAPTVPGKSTWLPLKLLEMGGFSGRIILLEPRRLAAKNLAWRLAEQLGETPGGTIGYRMRAETRVGPQTRIEVVTEGVLTRMLQRDAELTGVSLVILDEFHERSLQADLALALLLDVQQGLREIWFCSLCPPRWITRVWLRYYRRRRRWCHRGGLFQWIATISRWAIRNGWKRALPGRFAVF